MEELLVIALGALAVIAAPLVPGVRPFAKSAVKGGMALGSAAAAAAVAAGQQWDNLADKVGSKKSELNLPIVDGAATVVANAAQATSDAAAAVVDTAKSAAAAVTDTAKSAAAAVTDTAKSTAAVVTDGAAGAGADAANGAAAPVETAPAVIEGDDLTKISGIGAKTAGILAAAGITTYAQLAAATDAGLREILESAGPRYRLLDPATWPDQAGKLIAEESAE